MTKKGWLLILAEIFILWLLTNMVACEKMSETYKQYKIRKEVTKESDERKMVLLDKIAKGQKLDDFEISNLSAILMMENKYDEGINILEKLQSLENYSNSKYNIYFNLSLFYTEKAKNSNEKENRNNLIKKSEEYLTRGFKNTPEKAFAYYNMAKGYKEMGCMHRAESSLEEAIRTATSKDIIFYGDGIYLDRNKFIAIVTADLKRFQGLEETCILPH